MDRTLGILSLRDRILQATTKQEIAELLAEGDTYEFASHPTRGRWNVAAITRRRELDGDTKDS